jgi:hypothetical protein
VQPASLADAHRVEHHVTGDTVFVAIHAGPARREHEAAHRESLEALGDGVSGHHALEQPGLELVADHRRGARQPQELRRQALDARLDQTVERARHPLARGRLGLAPRRVRPRLAELLEKQRVASRALPDALGHAHLEGVGQ